MMLLDEYPSPPDNASLLNFFISPEEAADFNAETDSLLSSPNEDLLPPCYADILVEEAVEEERLMHTIQNVEQEFCAWTITCTVLNSLPSGDIYVVPMVEPEDENVMDPPEPDDTEVHWLNIVPVDSQITELPYVTAKYIVFNGRMFTQPPPPPPPPACAAATHTWRRTLRSYLHPTSHAEHKAEAPKELKLLPINREIVRTIEQWDNQGRYLTFANSDVQAGLGLNRLSFCRLRFEEMASPKIGLGLGWLGLEPGLECTERNDV
ncbi:hypothetical protein ARMGADRAFT_1031301 [Armillaria gallica]|uniref:Uncharacterized protein n=1 Tax=Armillaria gallica TaxID=47427 RepID=A0A2H3DU61_ARMGA|nr:hypothetical protein ARMGADRAFT_1031301 [Armillaria gallica]